MKIKVRDKEGENVEFNPFPACCLGCFGCVLPAILIASTPIVIAVALILK